jgi:hypothetical protein
MPESDYTLMRVPKVTRDRKKIRAERNKRLIYRELDTILDTVEAIEKSGTNKSKTSKVAHFPEEI